MADRHTYRVTWSEEDEEYVGLCEEFPSMSWLDVNPLIALAGIMGLVHRWQLDQQRAAFDDLRAFEEKLGLNE